MTGRDAVARSPTPRAVVAVLALSLAPLPFGPAPADAQSTGVDPDAAELRVFGEADYDWRIRRLGGEALELGRFRGEVLFINLWASWCTPCVRELASIERLRDRLGDADVRFLIVAAEGEDPVRSFLRRRPYDLPIYLEEERIPPAFGKLGLPTTWVVDRQGRIVLLRHGEAAWDQPAVADFLRALAAG